MKLSHGAFGRRLCLQVRRIEYAGLVLLVAIAGCDRAKAPAGVSTVRRIESDIAPVCEQIARDNLKAPATAVFPAPGTAKLESLADGRYRFHSWVDAQNSFGANIRTRYTCQVDTKDGEHFTAKSVEFENNP